MSDYTGDYTNYLTQVVGVFIANEENLLIQVKDIAKMGPGEQVATLKEAVELYLPFNDSEVFLSEFIGAGLEEVNWLELLDDNRED